MRLEHYDGVTYILDQHLGATTCVFMRDTDLEFNRRSVFTCQEDGFENVHDFLSNGHAPMTIVLHNQET